MNKSKSDEILKSFEKIDWAAGKEPEVLQSFNVSQSSKESSNESMPVSSTGLSYETATLLRMRQAAESISRETRRKEALKQMESENQD